MARGRNQYITALVALTFLVQFSGWVPPDATADPDPAHEDTAFGGSGYTHFVGDWYVDATEDLYYGNQTILLDGNLTINNTGRLVFSNVTLIFNCSGNITFRLEVNGSFEVVGSSNITVTNPSHHFIARARSGSNLEIRDSTIAECGVPNKYTGFVVDCDDAVGVRARRGGVVVPCRGRDAVELACPTVRQAAQGP